MRFSIRASEFLAELHVQSAQEEKQHHCRDVNQISHNELLSIRSIELKHPVTSYAGAVIKSWSDQVKK
jgi:hypothetical protein